MNPPWSILFFTTLAGAGQGLVVVLALAWLAGAVPAAFARSALGVALVLLVAGLGASFFHIGHWQRAWRAATMWRTSWMSREVLLFPVTIAAVAAWWWTLGGDVVSTSAQVLAVAALVLACALWVSTAMIYACLRFVQEWAHPLTPVNYTLMGLASGAVLAGLLASIHALPAATALRGWAIALTVAAGVGRWLALRRNARLVHRSTLATATGIPGAPLQQKAMGMTGGSYNTREFFHGASPAVYGAVRAGFPVAAYLVPAVLLVVAGASTAAWAAAMAVQAVGLLAERWFFFAEARHPQNLYYQVVS